MGVLLKARDEAIENSAEGDSACNIVRIDHSRTVTFLAALQSIRLGRETRLDWAQLFNSTWLGGA